MTSNPYSSSTASTLESVPDGPRRRHAYALLAAILGGMFIGAVVGGASSGTIGFLFWKLDFIGKDEPCLFVIGGVIAGVLLGAPMGVLSGTAVLFRVFLRDAPTFRVTLPNAILCGLFGALAGVGAAVYLGAMNGDIVPRLLALGGAIGTAAGAAGGWALAYMISRVYRD